MIQAVIFDMDGVIVDSVGFTVSTFIHVLRNEGLSVSDDFIASRIGIGIREVVKDVLDSNKKTYSHDFVEELASKIETYQEEQSHTLPVFDTFIPLTEALGNYKIGLATMSSKAQLAFKLKQVQFEFDAISCADDVSLPKPYPDVYLATMKKLGAEPSECIVIEDSVPGVQAAKNAKMKCIGVTTGYYKEKSLLDAGADIVFDNLKDKEAILKFISKL